MLNELEDLIKRIEELRDVKSNDVVLGEVPIYKTEYKALLDILKYLERQ